MPNQTVSSYRKSVFVIVTPLTPVEISVAMQLREGSTNKEIAAALGMEALTVKNRVVSILRKLRVHTRGRVIALMHRHPECFVPRITGRKTLIGVARRHKK